MAKPNAAMIGAFKEVVSVADDEAGWIFDLRSTKGKAKQTTHHTSCKLIQLYLTPSQALMG